tara:strand:+ start:124 stop:660 length:537 start_codon:yes stop_codon:yes gene_type:complete
MLNLLFMENLNKAAFLDRDGVINKNYGYVHSLDNFVWLKNVKKAIKFLNDKNYKVIVISNQSGIARKFYTEKDVIRLHKWMNSELKKINAKVDKFYFCPFHPKYGSKYYKKNSYYRKPNPGMLLEAIKKYNIEKEKSFMIGDTKSDQICANRAKIKFFFKRNNLLKDIRRILKKKNEN